jgi:hypothetical protein
MVNSCTGATDSAMVVATAMVATNPASTATAVTEKFVIGKIKRAPTGALLYL